MPIRKKLGRIIFSLLALLWLSGCWDQKEVEEQAYVIGIGIDKAEDQENRVKITYLISNPEAGATAQGGGSGEQPREIISFVADEFISSTNLANSVIAKQITYDLLRMIAVSEEFARDEQFIRWIYDATKAMEIKRDIKFLVTKEDTATFFQTNNPILETRPHEYFEKILNTGFNNGTIPKSELNQFFRITEADADLFLGIYSSSEKERRQQSGEDPHQITAGEFQFEGETNTTQFIGSAVFKEGQMIDSLTIEETRLAILLNPTLKPGFFLGTLPDPFDETYRIVIRVENNGPLKVDMKLKSGTPNIDVIVPLTIEVLSNHSMTDYPKDAEKRNKLKKSIQESLTKKIEDLIRKTQEEYKTEPFGWSLIARKKFSTLSEWENFDWMKTYPDMNTNVSVQIKLGKFGRQSDLPRIEEIRD
ncbi:Ger(x)C family spore germination protein [Ornithinibacillus californiensis]|uniref:Ger(x)C family spore germination protein n=1 Tax=Ornithinibacillus californiensis TaxID=161536 RepID=UPI00064DB3E7|nr:Ger(x)C family spore germination protein [Ornithinibacillus californiensis]